MIDAALRAFCFYLVGLQKPPDAGGFGAVLAHAQSLPLCHFFECIVAHICDAAGLDKVGEEAVCFRGPSENYGTANFRC